MKSLSLYLTWAALTLPAVFMVWAYRTDMISYGEALSLSGDMSIKLLLVTLAITPLQRILKSSTFVKFMVRARRALGVAVFGYAALHLWIYLKRKADINKILSESASFDLLTGWIAFALFLALAATSNMQSVRKMGRKWKQLHRLIYIGAVLTIIHWIVTAFDPTTAYIYGVILLGLLGLRWKYRAN